MWYMMCHFVLSKVVRYHLVLIHHQLILLSSQVLAHMVWLDFRDVR